MSALHGYDDDYATCEETYATLRVFSDSLDPLRITTILGVEPTKFFRTGDIRSTNLRVASPHYGSNVWLYSTAGRHTSRDCRRHLDLLIGAVLSNTEGLRTLRSMECDVDVTSFYSYTQGGPTLSPAQMSALAKADIDVWWDLYRADEPSRDDGAKPVPNPSLERP